MSAQEHPKPLNAPLRAHAFTEQELYYLRSILGNLRELNSFVCERQGGVSLQSEALGDNVDWLDCFIGDPIAVGDRSAA